MGKSYCDWLFKLRKGDEFVFVQGSKPNFTFSMGKVKGFTKTKIRATVGELKLEFEREGGRSVLGSQHGGMLPVTEELKKKIQGENQNGNQAVQDS